MFGGRKTAPGAVGAALAVAVLAIGCPKAPGSDSAIDVPVWQVACGALDDFVLSVWGPSPADVFFVGGNGQEGRALLLHYNGETWVRTLGVSDEVLWWVAGTSGQDVWAVGEDGEALHFDGGFWERTDTNTTATLYGVWASAPDAVWAVGGSIDPLGPKDVFLFWDGDSWNPAAPDVPSGESLFKVWGATADDIWAVGTGGAIFHFDGLSWTRTSSPTDTTLITVYGSASDDVWAVGGIAGGLLLHFDGSAWAVTAEGFSPSGLNAVWTEKGSAPVIAGHAGYAARYRASGPDVLPTGVEQGLHGVFGDGLGVWAVGGNLLGGAGPEGIILRFGAPAAKCAIVDFMQPPILGTDGGPDGGTDPCPGGTASVGPGGICASGRDCQCEPGLECWYVTVCWAGGPVCPPSGNAYSHFICSAPCISEADCQTDYGAGACCIVPGKQTVTTICHSPGYTPVDGDRCD